MLDSTEMFYVLAAFGVSLFFFGLAHRRGRLFGALPPGPTRLPFLGSIFDLPKGNHVEYFHKLSQKYGDVAYVDALGQPMVILGSGTAATDLLEKRSANYSDRQASPMATLADSNWMLVLLQCDPLWREQRKLIHKYLGSNALNRFHPVLETHNRILLRNLLDAPARFFDHIKFSVSAATLELTYGIKATGPDDEFVVLEDESLRAVGDVFCPGRYLVEVFPVLCHLPSWFPGCTFHEAAQEYKNVWDRSRNQPFDVSLELSRSGKAKENVVSLMVSGEAHDQEHVSEERSANARDASAVIYIGGADTMIVSLQVFILAMVLNPEVQATARAELDHVIGSDRLPVMSDVLGGSLPYTEAVMLEVLRWKPASPLGFPHRSREDDEYRGMFIPKGSIIVANNQAMSQDPVAYSDPENFQPERFLKDGRLNPGVLDPRSFAFGYGRRICPGRFLALQEMMFAIASILHAFVIEPPVDADGAPVYPPTESVFHGALLTPMPFECTFKPRSPAMESLIIADSVTA